MKALVLYATTEGQTHKIARFVADQLKEHGYETAISDLNNAPPAPNGYDLVIAGASVHIMKYQAAAAHYLKEYATELNQVKSAFLSVSMTAASDNQESWTELERITDHFLKFTGWQPTKVLQVAGALKYTKYDFFKKFVMRMISEKEGRKTDTDHDYEYTDWVALSGFLEALVKQV